MLFAFLLGVKGLGDGFKLLSGDLLSAFFASTENPFVGLVVGLLATTLVQSSSVTTSMIVGLVAAPENPLPLANAIPMVMGANIGTTVTNTVVSLAHMGRREEFRRAFAVATCHDFFNYLTVMVLLPLELLTGYLRSTAVMLGSAFEGLGGFEYESPIKDVLSAVMAPVAQLAAWLFRGQQGQAVFLILVSGLMIFTALLLLVKVMRSAVQTRVEAFISRALGSNAVVSIRHRGRHYHHGSVELHYDVSARTAGRRWAAEPRTGIAGHDRREYRHDGHGLHGGARGFWATCHGPG